MGIINRDLSSSEKKHVINCPLGLVSTGQTTALSVVPYTATLDAAQLAATGLSGAPNYSLWVSRNVAAIGVTAFCVGASLVAQDFGTSGGQTFRVSGAGIGSSFAGIATGVTLFTGDVLFLNTAAANTAAYSTLTLVLKALDDIKNSLGA